MKTVAWILAIVAVAYVGALIGLTWMQHALIYFPNPETMTPTAAGLPKAKVLHIQTADKENLVAWYVPAESGKVLFLYFSGNGGGLSDRVERFEPMTAGGEGLLAIAYRSYFGSTGTATEAGLHLDADAAYAEALKLGYAPDRIVVVGEIAWHRRCRGARRAKAHCRAYSGFTLYVDRRCRRGKILDVSGTPSDVGSISLGPAHRQNPCAGLDHAWHARRRDPVPFRSRAFQTRERTEKIHPGARRRACHAREAGGLAAGAGMAGREYRNQNAVEPNIKSFIYEMGFKI